MKAPPDPRLDILEKDLQKQVRQFAEALGWKVAVTWTSLHSPKGWPDLFMVRIVPRGPMQILRETTEAVALELKREKGKTTPEQDAWLELLAALPGVKFAGVIRPSNWYAGELDGVLR